MYEPYRMMIRNRIREYKRLFSVMSVPLLGVIGVFLLGGYLFITEWFWLLCEVHIEVKNIEWIIMAFVLLYSIWELTGSKRKTTIIIKSMTLHLLDENKIRRIVLIKILEKLPKIAFVSFILTLCVFGKSWTTNGVLVFSGFIVFLINMQFLKWFGYHECFSIRGMIAVWGVGILIFLVEYLNLLVSVLGLVAFMGASAWYSLHRMPINLGKYVEEMVFQQKMLTAQNYNNSVLLKSFAVEKRLRRICGNVQIPKWGRKYPILWKNIKMYTRILRQNMIVACVIFMVTLCIYSFEYFWTIPFLEIAEIRQLLLTMGIVAVYQITIQSVLNSMNELQEKSKEGLYIPLTTNQIVFQCSFPAMIVVGILSVFIGVILTKSWSTILSIVICMSGITCGLFYIDYQNHQMLRKLYRLFNIGLIITSYIFTIIK